MATTRPTGGPGGKGRAEFGDGHARAFDEEAGDQDDEEQAVHQGVVPNRRQPFGAHQVAAHRQAQQHDDGHQPGEVENQGETEVEVAFEEPDAEQRIE